MVVKLFIWSDIFIFIIAMLVVIVLCRVFEPRLNNQEKIERNYIDYNKIPRLTKTIHCCNDLENLRCNNGDLVELSKGEDSRIYFIYSNYEFHRLTISQVLQLEKDYNIRIMF